MKILIFI